MSFISPQTAFLTSAASNPSHLWMSWHFGNGVVLDSTWCNSMGNGNRISLTVQKARFWLMMCFFQASLAVRQGPGLPFPVGGQESAWIRAHRL
jgi:hypothetical protein